MIRLSAGILLYRRRGKDVEVLLLHPGGPLWSAKDSWTIPKGEIEPGEDIISAAKREFYEEVGVVAPEGKLTDLGSEKQSPVKINHIWGLEGDIDISKFSSNEFTMEWPPHSGNKASFPECDKAGWFSLDAAEKKLFASQAGFIHTLRQNIDNI